MNKELENILLKVGELYNKYGIKSVTMDDIARELGISKKTLYQYVENKEDLVGKVLNNILHKNDCSFKEIAKKKQNAINELLQVGIYIIQTIARYNHSAEYDLKKYYPHLFEQMHITRKDRMHKAILKNIQKGKKEGLYRKEMDDEIIAKIQTSRFINMNSNDFSKQNEVHDPKYILELFIYHIRGIATKEGIEELEQKLKNIDIQEYLK